MPATYDPIATSTFTNQSSVSFTDIPNTFTDLRLIYINRGVSANQNLILRMNNITTNSYAYSGMSGLGSGSIVGSSGTSNVNSIVLDAPYFMNQTIPTGFILDFFSYRTPFISRFVLSRGFGTYGSSNGIVSSLMGYHYPTTIVSSISLTAAGVSTTMSGTATLYGILRA